MDQPFILKKHKGLTVEEVYKGAKVICPELITEFLKFQLSAVQHLALLTSEELFFIDSQNIEIANGVIVTYPEKDLYRGDWSKAFERLFRNRISKEDQRAGFLNLNSYNTKIYSARKPKVEHASADPSYIKWCIETVKDFFIYPEHIKTLEALTTYSYLGIQVAFKTSGCFEYRPVIRENKYSFSTETLMINDKNYIKACEKTTRYESGGSVDNETECTYDRFGNSYAQDVEGYSDQEIDNIFGGEADASWNID